MPSSIFTDEVKPELPPLLIGVAEAAKMLSMGQTWLREQVDANAIPYLPMGSKIMFHPPELQRWIMSKMLNPVQDNTITSSN